MNPKFYSEFDATIPVSTEAGLAKLHLYCSTKKETQIRLVDLYLEHDGGIEHLGLRYDEGTGMVLPFDESDTDILPGRRPLLCDVLRQKKEQIYEVMQPKALIGQLEAYIAFSELDDSNSN